MAHKGYRSVLVILALCLSRTVHGAACPAKTPQYGNYSVKGTEDIVNEKQLDDYSRMTEIYYCI
jgi:hypothetical protein